MRRCSILNGVVYAKKAVFINYDLCDDVVAVLNSTVLYIYSEIFIAQKNKKLVEPYNPKNLVTELLSNVRLRDSFLNSYTPQHRLLLEERLTMFDGLLAQTKEQLDIYLTLINSNPSFITKCIKMIKTETSTHALECINSFLQAQFNDMSRFPNEYDVTNMSIIKSPQRTFFVLKSLKEGGRSLENLVAEDEDKKRFFLKIAKNQNINEITILKFLDMYVDDFPIRTQYGDCFCTCQTLIPGVGLSKFLISEIIAPTDWIDKMRAIQQTLIAVTEFHEKNLFHRDLLPGNILYDQEQNKSTLIDFDSTKKKVFLDKKHQLSDLNKLIHGAGNTIGLLQILNTYSYDECVNLAGIKTILRNLANGGVTVIDAALDIAKQINVIVGNTESLLIFSPKGNNLTAKTKKTLNVMHASLECKGAEVGGLGAVIKALIPQQNKYIPNQNAVPFIKASLVTPYYDFFDNHMLSGPLISVY